MGRPRLMLLIRHAQSEGNQNRALHQIIPDHRVKLTPEGWQQAKDAGHHLRTLLEPDDTIQVFTSPYRRTKETTEGILSTLTASPDDEAPSPFRRDDIKVYEEPRLREQDFGNFQPCSAEMQLMWQERADYGHFFYRIPNGESAADAYDRVAGFNETLFRNFRDDDFPSVCILVTHGLLARVFLMKWYHWSTSYFEDLKNINHCEFVVMRRNDETNKYILETQLRTWSETKRRSSAIAVSPVPVASPFNQQVLLPLDATSPWAGQPLPKSPSIPPRMWGGCVGGCNHKNQVYQRRAVRLETALLPSLDSAQHTQSATDRSIQAPRQAPTGLMIPGVEENKTCLAEDDGSVRSDEERAYSDAASDHAEPVTLTTSTRRRRPSRRQPTIEDLEDWIKQSGMGSGARAHPLGDEAETDDDDDDDHDHDDCTPGQDGGTSDPSAHAKTQLAVDDVL